MATGLSGPQGVKPEEARVWGAWEGGGLLEIRLGKCVWMMINLDTNCACKMRFHSNLKNHL